jgi:hypothetical protein
MVHGLEKLLFPSIADVAVVSVDVSNETVRIGARSTVAGSSCPVCGSWSDRTHSSYLRFRRMCQRGAAGVALLAGPSVRLSDRFVPAADVR